MARYRFAGVYLAKKEDKLVGVPYADVSIYLAGTDTPATIYTSETGSYYINTTPQLSTNENGEFEFYVDSADYGYEQKFKIVCSKPGYEIKTWDNVSVFPYGGGDALSIRGVDVTENLGDVIAVHDLLKYQGTQFVSENIDEILRSYYSPQPEDLLRYDSGVGKFIGNDINEVLMHYFNPNPGDLLYYNGTQFALHRPSYVLAHRSTAQSIPAASWTRVRYNYVDKDYRNEYNTSVYGFIPLEKGLYSINAKVLFYNYTPPIDAYLRLSNNGQYLGYVRLYSGLAGVTIQISETIEVVAGGTVWIEAYADRSCSLYGDYHTDLTITRIR